jgi:NADH-quinone oxidoreductase subunit L
MNPAMNPLWLWSLLLAPLVAAGAIGLFTHRSRALSACLSIGAIVFSFGVSLAVFRLVGHDAAPVMSSIRWLELPGFVVDWNFAVDRMSALMLLVVTGVGSAIHIYSIAYMKSDAGFSRFFAYLSLFTFSMLGIVISTNFIQIYLFWELVGVSSYLLIGFWFDRARASEAGRKAFIVNRIGDFGMMLGVLMLWGMTGSVDFAGVQSYLSAHPELAPCLLTTAGLLIFCGAVGKSAQLPLHVWLPDAMEGPTPVSALIHAATMVAAGVYMLCRVSWLLTPTAADVIAWTGGLTALFAAFVAIGQSDIKRVLAFSTMSQLGYMVMAVGLGGPIQAMVHLTAHAFFKALLFLAAGSVIMSLHHEQDIWKMGGLSRRMPSTFMAFLIGTLALAGVWPLSGFYTKDAILLLAYEKNTGLFVLAALAAVCTAFYMGRTLFVAFLGEPRDKKIHEHAHENGPVVLLPLAFLAILSIGAGWYGMIPNALVSEFEPEHHSLIKNLLMLSMPAVGFLLAAFLYLRRDPSDSQLRRMLGPAFECLVNRFYVDELYGALIRNTQGRVAAICACLDGPVLQGGVLGGLGGITKGLAGIIRLLQSGDLRFYAFSFGIGAALLIYLASNG